jgi:tRNA (mo5U34)-methyltransferase
MLFCKHNQSSINWYHSFQFPDGSSTKGTDESEKSFQFLAPHLPDFNGKDILDIGAWDGFYSYKAKQLGARKVLATDYFCWSGPGWGTKDGFDFAGKKLNLHIDSLEIDPAQINPNSVGMFDIVLFLGVLYHRPDCFQALTNAASVCQEHLIVETLIHKGLDEDQPLLQFYPFDEVYGDHTNWFIPNIRCVYDMLKSCGFNNIEHHTRKCVVGPHIYQRGAFFAKRSGGGNFGK